MVHRDIKPSNLILARPRKSGSPPILRLLDLGLARLEGATSDQASNSDINDTFAEPASNDQWKAYGSSVSLTGSILGTAEYMAPEQVRHVQRVDVRADIYALGATLYRLLAGHPPVQGTSPIDIMRRKIDGDVTVLDSAALRLPPKLVTAVHKMLMTNPDDRFESPSDVIKTLAPFRRGADLAGLVGVRGGREPTTSPIESTRSWVLGIGASLVVIAFVWFGIDRSDRRISTDETFTNASVDAAPTSRADLASKESSPGLASLDTTTHSQAEIETERDWLAVVPFSSQQANSLQRSWSERLRVPIERIDQLGSGNELTTVLIPPGQFKMGPDPDWQWNEKNRVSQVSVDLDWFRIGKFEITCEQWDAVFRNSNFAKRPTANQELSGMPIGNVSHVQATRYCQLLTKHCRRLGALTDGWEFALPTEAQWEFACRAGTITRTSFGNNLTPRQANIRAGKNSQWKGFQYPVPVGKYPANPFGLHDMHGNQWEWCRDVFARLLIAGSDPLQQDKGDQRTLRGGSWADEPNPIRWTSANRYGRGVEQKFSGVGFRVVLTRLR